MSSHITRITEYLTEHPLSKARMMESALSIPKSEINRVLYANRNLFTVNESFQWSMKEAPSSSIATSEAYTSENEMLRNQVQHLQEQVQHLQEQLSRLTTTRPRIMLRGTATTSPPETPEEQ